MWIYRRKYNKSTNLDIMIKWIIKELVLKLDFEKGEFDIGWIWIILMIPKSYLGIKLLLHDITFLVDFLLYLL